jgi:cytochrome c
MRRLAPLALALLLAGCGGDGGTGGGGQAEGPSVTPAVELTATERQARLAALPAPYNAADLENGRKQYGKCRSCHTIAEGGPNLTGPNLYGVFGRKAGAVPDYAYSETLVGTGWTWDAAKLDGWLANPREYLPGTKMSFAGLRDETDRRDLIGYLKVETGYQP